jgi:colanic acid/amylovoran biosynthesis protein
LKILITGLCLQGNKGGPALAISLINQLDIIFPQSDFTLSVPAAEYKLEKKWVPNYNLTIVSDFSHIDFTAYLLLFPFRFKREKVKRWLAVLSKSDLVVDMSAISYVGPPIGNTKKTLQHGRFKYFILSRIFRKSFMAWTQSYGPFSTSIMRFIARIDLKCQPIIFCRGKDCAESVKKLLPNKHIRSYPDVAITLEYSKDRGQKIVSERFPKPGPLITLSPSAVIFTKEKSKTEKNRHIEQMIWLCQHLSKNGYNVLLLPHTYRPENHNPTICDYAVCRLIYVNLTKVVKEGRLSILEEDLSPIDLKSIISNAHIHIGGRYHSLIASLSTSIPSIALSWHPKYRDIMRQYGLENFVIEPQNNPGFQKNFQQMFNSLINSHMETSSLLSQQQVLLESKIKENRELFFKSYDEISDDL